MKKIIFLLIISILFMPVFVSSKERSRLIRCIDGDTARFKIGGRIRNVRFLAIDTPEVVDPKKNIDTYSINASIYTCKKLKSAKNIYIEYDDGSSRYDIYGRVLAWVFVDDVLLQDLLVREGYARVYYLYGDYKYTDMLKKSESVAKKLNLRIWNKL